MLLNAKDKHHQAEKPIELYEYLIKNFTDEKDVCLDQFGGSCNMLKAAVNLNRFAIVYELAKEYVKNAVDRFKCRKLYEETETSENAVESPTAKDEEDKVALTFLERIKARKSRMTT